jgi:hypothetical protein
LEPAAAVHSLSLLHAGVVPIVPAGSQTGLPFVSLQTKLEGQPELEQSPVWHLLSAPQVPPGQSDGLVHVATGGVTPVTTHRAPVPQAYPSGQSESP